MNMKKDTFLGKCGRTALEKAAKIILSVEANSASCILMYQPTSPDELKKYRFGYKNEDNR